ncbi:hypothetical protein NNRS527_02406 [Nitrosospira sp. NRS527]|nr:hypothetical protein NNRS527_02406 [Nitrosospira sp. NRS527]
MNDKVNSRDFSTLEVPSQDAHNTIEFPKIVKPIHHEIAASAINKKPDSSNRTACYRAGCLELSESIRMNDRGSETFLQQTLNLNPVVDRSFFSSSISPFVNQVL